MEKRERGREIEKSEKEIEAFKRIQKRLEVHFQKNSPETDEPCLLYANQRHIFVQGELKLVIQTDFMSRLDAGLASPFFTLECFIFEIGSCLK